MARAKITIDEKEFEFGDEPATFGRTADNLVPFPDNTNISRNHARIDYRDGAFWLSDLGSSNGTTVNGQKFEGELKLNDGDLITLGNSVIAEFKIVELDEEEEEAAAESGKEAKSASGAPSSSKLPLMLGIAGATVGLAVVFVAAAFVVPYMMSSSACDATAQFSSPENGETISGEQDVNVVVNNGRCVSRVIVVLNGKELASMTSEPYTTTIDSKNFAELSDGGLYPLQVVLEDSNGTRMVQPGAISLAFETRKTSTPTPTPTEVANASPTPAAGGQKQVSLIDTQKISAAVVGKFTGGNFKYNVSNPEFLREVQKRSAEYASEGYFARAAQYRDVINQFFIRERNLDPSLAYILAMSRSKFFPAKQGTGEGLWQMSSEFTAANAYHVVCGTETLLDPSQACSSKAAAVYMEDLVVKVFDGDIVYAVAAFGKTAQEANIWKLSLPADRSDFWKHITDPKQREEVVRFFAAAAVAENPQRFGLTKDRPISELYPPVAGR